MVKLVDTLASGASGRKAVEVQVLSWAPHNSTSPVAWPYYIGLFGMFLLISVIFSVTHIPIPVEIHRGREGILLAVLLL